MRSLFAKILAWFVVSILVTIAATVLTSALTYDAYSARQAPFSMLLSLEVREARHAWESGGAVELRGALDRLREVNHASKAMLLDGNGMDVLTGESHAGMLPYAEGLVHSPFSLRSHIFGRKSTDGRYVLILVRENWYFWFLQPAHLLVLALTVLLCYGFAHYLTAPVRRLRSAVDRLGRGDLAARAEESRKDEL